jgi:hypothetical protein
MRIKSTDLILFASTLSFLILLVSSHKSLPTILSKSSYDASDILIDAFQNNLSDKRLKVYNDISFEQLKIQTMIKYSENDYAACYEELNKYTMDMFDNPIFKDMLNSGFTDVGDLGNYEQ